MYYAYVLINGKGEFYKGHSDDMNKRLREHNSGVTKSTRKANDWKIVYNEEYKTREEAIKREKYFKSSAGRKFLKHKLAP